MRKARSTTFVCQLTDIESLVWKKNVVFYNGNNVDIFSQIYNRGLLCASRVVFSKYFIPMVHNQAFCIIN